MPQPLEQFVEVAGVFDGKSLSLCKVKKHTSYKVYGNANAAPARDIKKKKVDAFVGGLGAEPASNVAKNPNQDVWETVCSQNKRPSETVSRPIQVPFHVLFHVLFHDIGAPNSPLSFLALPHLCGQNKLVPHI